MLTNTFRARCDKPLIWHNLCVPENTNDTTTTRLVRSKEAARERLTAAREAKKWSQAQLADESGVNISTIRQIEQGSREMPVKAAEAFQHVFRLPAPWFMGWTSPEALPTVMAAEGLDGDPGNIPVGRHALQASAPSSRKRDAG